MKKYPDKNFISEGIYGMVTCLAVILIMESHLSNYWDASLTLFGSVLVVTLAKAYSDTIAEVITQKRKLELSELRIVWYHAAPILISANIPTLIILLSGLGLYSVSTALYVSKIFIYILLFLYGIKMGQLMHESRIRIIFSGLMTCGIGLLISFIKMFFH